MNDLAVRFGRWGARPAQALVAVVLLVGCSGSRVLDGVACDPMVFVSAEQGDEDIWLLSTDGEFPLTGPGLAEANPAFSPDATLIAFTRGTSNEDGRLVSIAADGTDLREVWDGDGLSVSSVDWGPAGMVVDAHLTASGIPIQVFVLDDGPPEQLTDTDLNFKPTWAAEAILYSSKPEDGNQDIWLMQADGADPRNLTASPTTRDLMAELSPDGSSIAFVLDRTGDFEIWLMAPDGSGLQQLTDNLGDDRNPTWSSDGRHILFTSDRNGPHAIWAMEADGSNERPVRDPGWVPDCP